MRASPQTTGVVDTGEWVKTLAPHLPRDAPDPCSASDTV